MIDDDKIVIDNNIWVAYEEEYPNLVNFIDFCIEDEIEILMPTVIEMELMSHFEIETIPKVKEAREAILELVDDIFDIDRKIAQLAGSFRRKLRAKGLRCPKGPDSLIAASAFLKDATVISNNDKDFIPIRDEFGVKYYNPIKDQEQYREYKENLREKRSEDT